MRLLAPSLIFGVLLTTACTSDKGDTGPATGDGGGGEETGGDGGTPLEDQDGDGYLSDVDCDDNDYRVYPGAEEQCDGTDQDCDGDVDEDFDVDLDGYLDVDLCEDLGDDCDDSDEATYPGAPEVYYDGVDQDCDGADVDDADGDGFIATEAGGNDCDDLDPAINPRAEEIALDGIDQDCDGEDDADGDGDGFNEMSSGGDDCDDSDPSVYPGAPRDWMNDGVDTDCDEVDGAARSINAADALIEGTTSAQSYVGESVVLCDLDEDGMDDLVVTAPFDDSYSGNVGIWYGAGVSGWTSGMGLADADATLEGSTGGFFGLNAVCADLDGDGHLDLALQRGEIDYGTTFQSDFAVYLFYGDGGARSGSASMSTADAVFSYEMGVSTTATTVRTAPVEAADLDGDGKSELVITMGHPDFSIFDGEGRVLVLPGGRYAGDADLGDALSHVMAPEQSWQFGGETPWYLSRAMVQADLDLDLAGDLVVLSTQYASDYDSADPGAGDDVGRLDWMGALPTAGADLVLDDSIEAGISGSFDNMRFGYRAIVGDFDGDGALDLLVSSAGDAADGTRNTGGLFVFLDAGADLLGGGGDALDLADGWAYGSAGGQMLGYALAAAGDVDGDGADDFLVSAPSPSYTDDSGVAVTSGGAGSVWLVSGALFSGEVSDLATVCLQQWTDTAADHYTGSALTVGDVDGDGLPDFSFGSKNYGYSPASTGTTPGRAYVFYGADL